jgi:hypothetical protein
MSLSKKGKHGMERALFFFCGWYRRFCLPAVELLVAGKDWTGKGTS